MLYLKFSTGNYSIAGKRGHWPASKDISLPYIHLLNAYIEYRTLFLILGSSCDVSKSKLWTSERWNADHFEWISTPSRKQSTRPHQ